LQREEECRLQRARPSNLVDGDLDEGDEDLLDDILDEYTTVNEDKYMCTPQMIPMTPVK
jgi:hypothetical protein